MKLTFSPTLMHGRPEISVSGDILTVDGEAFDFSAIPERATLPRAAVDCVWLASDVERVDGEIRLALLLSHGPDAPEQTRFPEPVTITDGPVPLPPFSASQQQEPQS